MRTLLFCTVLLAACDPTGKSTAPPADHEDTASEGDSGDSGTTDDGIDDPIEGEGCRSEYRDPDADRTVLANLSFQGTGENWAVLTLSADGTLTDTGETVSGGRTYLNPGVFTPDGSLGVVALDDGTLTIFAVDDSGAVTVVDAGWTTGFYAVSVGMDASGERIYVVDQNWEENGGGLYVFDLDCETGLPSAPTDLPLDSLGRLVEAKLPAAALPIPGRFDRLAMVGGVDGHDVTLIDTTTGTVLDELDVFGDDGWLSVGAINPAGDLLLLTDTSVWSEEENSVAAVTIDGDTLSLAGRSGLFDGVGIAMGPDNTTAVVSSGYADSIIRLALSTSVDVAGTLSTSGGSPQLPGGMVTVQRGTLAGHTLVSEIYGLRNVMMGIDGEALDLGVVNVRSETPAGVLIQP